MAIIHGRNIIIKSEGVAIASARSCDLQVSCGELETSNPDDGSWRTFYADRKEWNITLNYLVIALRGLQVAVGQTYTITIENTTDEDDLLTGTAICTDNSVTATIGNLSQGTFRFKGTGPLG